MWERFGAETKFCWRTQEREGGGGKSEEGETSSPAPAPWSPDVLEDSLTAPPPRLNRRSDGVTCGDTDLLVWTSGGRRTRWEAELEDNGSSQDRPLS